MEPDGPRTPRQGDGAGKRAHPKYNAGQKQVVAMCFSSGLRYREFLAAHPEVRFSLECLKPACARSKKNGAMGRAMGSGGQRSRGAADRADSVRQYFEENGKASCGDAASDFGIPKATMRMILTQ